MSDKMSDVSANRLMYDMKAAAGPIYGDGIDVVVSLADATLSIAAMQADDAEAWGRDDVDVALTKLSAFARSAYVETGTEVLLVRLKGRSIAAIWSANVDRNEPRRWAKAPVRVGYDTLKHLAGRIGLETVEE